MFHVLTELSWTQQQTPKFLRYQAQKISHGTNVYVTSEDIQEPIWTFTDKSWSTFKESAEV